MRSMKKLRYFPTEELNIMDDLVVTIGIDLDTGHAFSEKDQIKLGNLTDQARKEIQENYPDQKADFDKQLDQVAQNEKELLTSTSTLVLFVTKDDIYYYHIGLTTPDTLVVGQGPYLKLLIKYYQYSHAYHVLVLNQDSAKVYAVDGKQIEDISDQVDPLTIEEILGTEKTGGELNHTAQAGGRQGTSFHGHNEISEEKDIDRENFFRQVDQIVYENYSLEEELPLILYALPENQTVFRELSDNQYLVADGIEASGANVSSEEIRDRAVELGRKIVEDQQKDLINRFNETPPNLRLEEQLGDLAMASLQGKIEELVVQDDYQQAGSISPEGRYVEDDGNFVKQVVLNVLKTQGKVYVLAEEKLPEGIHIAARLRYE